MKTHEFDAISFFSGVVITGIGLLFLIPNSPSDIFDLIARMGNWFWPAVLLAIGTAVLVPVFMPKRNEKEDDQSALTG